MRGDHYYLSEKDLCTFMGEYTARAGYSYSSTNQLISNFKKPVSARGTSQWPHKQRAIETVGASLATCLSPWADEITLVPVPPSKCKNDRDHDDRLVQALSACQRQIPSIECRELVIQTVSTDAAHSSAHRPRPDELEAIYVVDKAMLEGVRDTIIIVDDMLTTGCHFKAMEAVLRNYLPDHVIAGVFVARRIPEADFL